MLTPEERRERRAETLRRYREKNRAEMNEKERLRKLSNRDRRKHWASSSPEKRKEYYVRYRSKERTATVAFEQRLRMKFGIGVDDYHAILERQKFGCAICGSPHGGVHRRSPNPLIAPIQRLAVDHDHLTGRIRGLLCRKCNTGIGLFDENHDLLAKASEYLKK